MSTTLTVSPRSSAEAIAREAWARLCPPAHPFINADFFAILERHGAAGRACGWIAQHLVASDASGVIVGILPLYFRFNSHGDFIHDWSWASAYAQLGRSYYPKLLSALPHTPASGPRFLLGPDAGGDRASAPGNDRDRIRGALIEAAQALAGQYGASSWHVAFPGDDERQPLREAGLIESHNVQFHWRAGECADFDDYLATFTAEKRRKVKAERRRVRESGLLIDRCHGDDVDAAEWPLLHALYASTFDKFGNIAVLSSACLADLGRTLGRRMVIFIARAGSEAVAVSICFRSDEALYGRYWGCSGSYHSLHFELCFYQGIEYCLRHGLRRFEPGAGGEHKIARGFTPTVVGSLHWIADPSMRTIIARHLERQGSAVAAYRDEAADHLPFRCA